MSEVSPFSAVRMPFVGPPPPRRCHECGGRDGEILDTNHGVLHESCWGRREEERRWVKEWRARQGESVS